MLNLSGPQGGGKFEQFTEPCVPILTLNLQFTFLLEHYELAPTPQHHVACPAQWSHALYQSQCPFRQAMQAASSLIKANINKADREHGFQ